MISPFSALPLAGEPLTEQSRADLKRLALRTELDDKLALHFASVVPFYRLPDCVREFRLMLPKGVHVVEIRFEETTVTPIPDLLERVPPECFQTPEHPVLTPDDRWVVCVFGLDESLDAITNPAAEAALFQLNVQRDRLLQLRAPLVFWLREDTLDRIATRIPDFWSWAGRTIRIREPVPTDGTDYVLDTQAGWQLASLPGSAKRARIAALEPYARRSLDAAATPRELVPVVRTWLELGHLWLALGETDRADEAFHTALQLTPDSDTEDPHTCLRLRLVAWSGISDVALERGDFGEARRIRSEEELPVSSALGDEVQLALTHGRIADVDQQMGNFEAALRVRKELELPVYIRRGNEREAAITQGKIADALVRQGRIGEALAIREQQELPVYVRLGDAVAVAATKGKIADGLFRTGEYDTALRVLQDEVIPAFDALGNLSGAAVAHLKVAQIYSRRGDFDHSLQIRRETVLPLFTRIGDRRSVAVTTLGIALTLHSMGRFDEAESLLLSSVLPELRASGDCRELANATVLRAEMLIRRGALDEALQVLRQDAMQAFERAGDRLGMAVAQGRIAEALFRSGAPELALQVRRTIQLPLLLELKDMREIALANASIAEILASMGRTQDALQLLIGDVLPQVEDAGLVVETVLVLCRTAEIRLLEGDVPQVVPLLRRAWEISSSHGLQAWQDIVLQIARRIPGSTAGTDLDHVLPSSAAAWREPTGV